MSQAAEPLATLAKYVFLKGWANAVHSELVDPCSKG